MKHGYKHIDPDSNPGNMPDSFFQRVEVPFAKSREDAWAELEKKLNEAPPPRISNFKFQKTFYAVAASIILLAGIFSLLRFYSTSVYCPAGEHLTVALPDGSAVKLNADSKISYKTFWWRFARQVEFDGEAYFEVQKGKKFEVKSRLGTTEVLGTSFNIYSRGDEYNVTCITGKVKVTSGSAAEAVLSPEYEARVDASGNIVVVKETKAGENQSWVNNMFHFTARPLPMVLNEIGRQFNISITSKVNLDYSYTGYFSKDRTAEEVLDFVCKPFGLTFARISENEYEIYQNPD
jgi:ferric-dicitrate binding protein FerR (iron transport regulator)